MKSSTSIGAVITPILFVAVSTALAGSGGTESPLPATTAMSGGDYNLSGRLTSGVDALSLSVETWRLGFPSEGQGNGAVVAGQAASETGAFRSAEATDSYYIFPAAATVVTVRAAQFYILKRTGAYSGDAVMSLEIIDADGQVRHTASTSSVNVATAPVDAWTPITLASLASDDLEIASGERLAFHCRMSAGVGGDLDVRTAFEVQVRSGFIDHPIIQFFPILGREYRY